MHNIPTIHFKKGDVIIHEGEPSNSIFLIVGGKVSISKNAGKKPLILATQGKNTIFGEMTLIDGQRRSATVTALEDTFCYRCDTMSMIEQLNKIDIDLLRGLKSLVSIIRKNNLQLISGGDSSKYESELDIPQQEGEKNLMAIEELTGAEMQGKIKALDSSFIQSLFRILISTATKK